MFQFTLNQVLNHQMLYTVADINQVLADNMIGFSIAGLLVYAIGFSQYGTALYMQYKDHESPWYMFQHAYYFGHDFTFVLSFSLWFGQFDFWLFKVLWAGCVVFCFIELYTLYLTIKYERNEVFGGKPGHEVSVKEAWIKGIACYFIGFAVFYLLRIGLGDTCCLMLMMSTNWIVAVFPSFLAEKKATRKNNKIIVLAVLVIIGTIFTFAPNGIGFWATASEAFRGPWFVIAGIIALIGAFRNLYVVCKLPKEDAAPALEEAAL